MHCRYCVRMHSNSSVVVELRIPAGTSSLLMITTVVSLLVMTVYAIAAIPAVVISEDVRAKVSPQSLRLPELRTLRHKA